METAVSVLAAGLLGEATGAPAEHRADAVAVAKRDLRGGEELDGEGGWTVYGALVPFARSVEDRLLPIGLAHGVRLVRPVAAGSPVRITDIDALTRSRALELRDEGSRQHARGESLR
jgi:predicted homoserine dehydrogenase-like protein